MARIRHLFRTEHGPGRLFMVALVFLGVVWSSPAGAGSISLDRPSLLVNQRREAFSLALDEVLSIDFGAVVKSHASRGEHAYLVLRFDKRPLHRMVYGIGPGRVNLSDDLVAVQVRLTEKGFWDGRNFGLWSEGLYEAILTYQKSIGFLRPDGIIEKDGPTWQMLQDHHSVFFLARLSPSETTGRYSLRTETVAGTVLFRGLYDMSFCSVPLYDEDLRYARIASPGPGRLVNLEPGASYYLETGLARFDFEPFGTLRVVPVRGFKMPAQSVFISKKSHTYRIEGSVGPGCLNLKTDVACVQRALQRMGLWENRADGVWSPELAVAVRQFQTRSGFNVADGIIEPNGITWRLMAGEKNDAGD